MGKSAAVASKNTAIEGVLVKSNNVPPRVQELPVAPYGSSWMYCRKAKIRQYVDKMPVERYTELLLFHPMQRKDST